jgi:hypothetical protein
MDNHFPRLTLWTDPQGRSVLLELRRYVMEKLQISPQVDSLYSDVMTSHYY